MSRKPPKAQLAPQLKLASAVHLRFMIETRVGDVQPGPKKDSLVLFHAVRRISPAASPDHTPRLADHPFDDLIRQQVGRFIGNGASGTC